MSFESPDNLEAYCSLKYHLEPRFQVVAEPSTDYYSEWMYCYRIYDGDALLHELRGDYRELRSGQLAASARDLVNQLTAASDG
jgi:hypothetical protein